VSFSINIDSFVKLKLFGDNMKLNANDFSKGEIIKFIREWTSLTQKEFAKKVHKSKRTIEQYEAGTVNYNIQFLQDVAKMFDIEIIISKKKK